MKKIFVLREPLQAHKVLTEQAWPYVKAMLVAGNQLKITVAGLTRTLEQNSLLWALLGEISKQVEWHGQMLSADDWKEMLTAALKKQRVVPGIEGGFVVLGSSTSKMSIPEMTELIELIYAFGAERGVVFSEQ